ncbi:DNA repair and recombination protein rhm52 [Madurella mycetomatis]|uniref:RAD52 homolog n=1 Tax=Madurella mycetomatis TaxID=100816 RepID=A0A175WBC7_9PEZI|nr:DNA repair and recombination protein rhm52 [Madurella mycetomatis]
MPAPGDQHTSIANPFQEPQQRVSEYTAKEIATLQSRLEKQLGPEYLSSRVGPAGQKVHYITAEKCITLANEVFGFNGWSSSIQNIQVDFVDENPQTLKISLGLSVIVRVTLRDGTYHEDLGYGHIENCKGKAAAFEKAKKEGTTDALKRALRHFGNVLGNCIYDKAYLAKVTKIKVAPSRFDENCLHRHPDFVVKKEVTESDASKGETAAVAPPAGYSSRSGLSSKSHDQTASSGNGSMQPPARPLAAGNNPAGGEAVGFFSARAISQLPYETLDNGHVAPKAGQVFNPRLESPSIRKTPGIDHTKSKPVARNGQHVPPAVNHSDDGHNANTNNSGPGGARPMNAGAAPGLGGQPPLPRPAVAGVGPPLARGNMINPQLDQTRRIGAPGSSSPLANRGQYKPPTIMKRPAADGSITPAEGRPPLSDKPSNKPVNGNGSGPEVKRLRTS